LVASEDISWELDKLPVIADEHLTDERPPLSPSPWHVVAVLVAVHVRPLVCTDVQQDAGLH
jgi:hypothetical protein